MASKKRRLKEAEFACEARPDRRVYVRVGLLTNAKGPVALRFHSVQGHWHRGNGGGVFVECAGALSLMPTVQERRNKEASFMPSQDECPT